MAINSVAAINSTVGVMLALGTGGGGLADPAWQHWLQCWVVTVWSKHRHPGAGGRVGGVGPSPHTPGQSCVITTAVSSVCCVVLLPRNSLGADGFCCSAIMHMGQRHHFVASVTVGM